MRVGNKTRCYKEQAVDMALTSNVELLDTPGVLWPKIAKTNKLL